MFMIVNVKTIHRERKIVKMEDMDKSEETRV